MNLIRKVLTTLGGILLAALLIAALAPKATRGLTAAMVQVVNTNSNPVPYFDVNNPATEPFDASLCVSNNAVVFGEDFICSAGSGASGIAGGWSTGSRRKSLKSTRTYTTVPPRVRIASGSSEKPRQLAYISTEERVGPPSSRYTGTP